MFYHCKLSQNILKWSLLSSNINSSVFNAGQIYTEHVRLQVGMSKFTHTKHTPPSFYLDPFPSGSDLNRVRSRLVGRVQMKSALCVPQSVENAPHLRVPWLGSFLSFPGSSVASTRHRCLPHRVPCAATSCSPPPPRRRSAQSRAVSAARARVGRAHGWRSFATRCPPRIPLFWAPSNRQLQPGPRDGEYAIRCEALPQLPAATPGASLDRGFSGRGSRPRAGTTSRPRVSPPSCTLPSGLSPC